MEGLYKPHEYYAIADEKGQWWQSNAGPYKTKKGAERVCERERRWLKGARVVKMIPIFFDAETGERITELPEGMV